MKSVQDYINGDEAKKILLRTVGAGSLTQLVLMVAVAMLNGAGAWYTGPGAAMVIMACSTLASALAGVKSAAFYLNQGAPIAQAHTPQTSAK